MRKLTFHWNSIIRFVLRLGLGILFLYAAWSKWFGTELGPKEFAQTVANFRLDTISVGSTQIHLLPPSLVPLFSIFILAVEVVLGILLILGIWEKEITLLAIFFLLMFGVATGSLLIRNIQMDCGCFGKGNSPATWDSLIWKNVLPFFFSLLLLLLMKFKPQDLASSRSHDNS